MSSQQDLIRDRQKVLKDLIAVQSRLIKYSTMLFTAQELKWVMLDPIHTVYGDLILIRATLERINISARKLKIERELGITLLMEPE